MTSASPILKILILGSQMVEWRGKPLHLPRRQVRALLYRLAADATPIPREHLAFLFWPDVPENTARRNLTGLLAHLRRNLPDPDLVEAHGDQIELDWSRAWSDLASLKVGSIDQPAGTSMSSLRAAVDAHRGELLDGFSLPDSPEYESWITMERQNSERLYLEALTLLIDDFALQGSLNEAIAYAQRYLETDDLAEEIHRRLMELYVATGDRAAALRQYEECADILESELGVEPLPETQALHRAVLASPGRAIPETPVVRFPGLGLDRGPEPVWTTLPGLDAALVGREEALKKLHEAHDRANRSGGSVVLVSGEPGVGKSRLVQEFAAGLGDKVQLLLGTCYREARTQPYQPLLEALRPALIRPTVGLDLPTWCLAEVALLVPELRSLHPSLPRATTEADPARSTLFEALAQLVLALAAGQRTVLFCLDDLHWADGTTVDWILYLARLLASRSQVEGVPQAKLMLVATFRTEEVPAVEHLRRGLARLGLLEELHLSGLGLADIRQLLRPLEEMLPVDDALVQRLHKVTGGNPFFLLEMLRSMVENGCRPEDLADPAELCLPDTVREAIAARVDRLSATSRQVLEAASVLGRSFSFELLRNASGRGEPETVNALDELVQRLFLEEGTTGFWFRHEITQSAVYHLLSRQRRTVLHRRAAATLERLDPSDVAALARHFELGGQPSHAARFAMQAGRAAKEVFAHDEARAQFEKALELLEWEAIDLQDDEAIAANRRLRLEALHERGWALRLVGEMEAYAEDLQDVGRLASALGDAKSLAHLQWREAYAHRWFCRYAQALASANEGVALSRQASNSLLEAMCQREIGMASRALGNYAVAREALEKALALFVELGETVYEIHTLGNLATLSWYEGRPEQALDLSGRALQRCDEAGLPLQRRLPLGDMGAAAVAMGALDLARQSLDESLSIARQTADRTQEILCLIHLGWLAVRLRRGNEALEHFSAGLKLAERIRSCNEQSWLQAGLAEAHRLSGERQQALTHARQAQELAKASGAAYDRKLANWVLTRLE